MAFISCQVCNKRVLDNAKICPYCGVKLQKKSSYIIWLISILLIVSGFALNTYIQRQDEETNKIKNQTTLEQNFKKTKTQIFKIIANPTTKKDFDMVKEICTTYLSINDVEFKKICNESMKKMD